MKKTFQKILSDLAGKIGVVSLMAICFIMFNSKAKAQTLLVNYDFNSAVAGTPCLADPSTTAPGVTSFFTTGGTDGETCKTYVVFPADTAGGNQPDLGVSVSTSNPNAVNYFQFQLIGVSAFRDYKLYFGVWNSGVIDVQYSLDGVNFTSFKQLPPPVTKIYFPGREVDFSSVPALNGQSTVYFRLESKSSRPDRGLTFIISNMQIQATATAAKSRKRVRFF
jgi:hypothetical protein